MCQAVNLRYYCVLKINDILAPATTGKNLKDIILSEITQSQKDKYCDSTYLRCTEEADLQRHKVDGGWGIGPSMSLCVSSLKAGSYCCLRSLSVPSPGTEESFRERAHPSGLFPTEPRLKTTLSCQLS